MEEQEQTELEKVLKLTLERQNHRIANLTMDLDLAHSQIHVLQEENNKLKELSKEAVGKAEKAVNSAGQVLSEKKKK